MSVAPRSAAGPMSVLCQHHERLMGGERSQWLVRPLLNDSCPACVVETERDDALTVLKACWPSVLSWCQRFPQPTQPEAAAAHERLKARGLVSWE